MKILIYGINYAPELTGIGKYTAGLASYLAEQGDEVEVITAPPYYPNWEVQAPYTSSKWLDQRIDGVRVLRSPLYVPREVSGVKRILHEVTFIASSLRWWVPRLFRRYDAIVAVSPPFHLGALPLLHRLLHGTPIVNHVQDLQVDAARDLEILSNAALLRSLEWLERKLLGGVDRVSSISPGMLRRLTAKPVPPERLVSFPNWVDEEVVHPLPKARSLRAAFGIPMEKTVVMYTGNLGEKQGLDALPRVAERLQHREDFLFLIVGEGGSKAALIAEVERRGLTNVQFEGLQPSERHAALFATPDVHLVLQRRAAADLVMPSKLTNIVAAHGHAVITAEPGTSLHDVVVEWRAGTVIPPEDDDALLGAIVRVADGEATDDITGVADFARTILGSTTLPAFREVLLGLAARSDDR